MIIKQFETEAFQGYAVLLEDQSEIKSVHQTYISPPDITQVLFEYTDGLNTIWGIEGYVIYLGPLAGLKISLNDTEITNEWLIFKKL